MTIDVDRSLLVTRLRSDACGVLRTEDVNREVTLCGWVAKRREHGEHLAFVDLRDTTGVVQCVFEGSIEARSEWVIKVKGTVRARPEGTLNAALPTGEIEIADCEVEVLAEAEPPPFPVTDRVDADENLRLRHRYIDLRRDRMQRNLRIRAKVNGAIRSTFDSMGFTEVETPMLMAPSPEGSREFLVPSRFKHGSFFALPQSPQLYKQLLMVGGLDRYYQLARCLRDEDLRADRQFEFTQLDMEASFVTEEDIWDFVSEAVLAATKAAGRDETTTEIPKITWHDAMEKYGVDKPDVRFGMELVELTEVFTDTDANVFKAKCVKGIRVSGGAELTRARIDALTEMAKGWGAKGLAWAKVIAGPVLEGGISKLLSEGETAAIISKINAEPSDMVFLVADERSTVRAVLGALRLELGRPPVNEGGLHFVWVTDFPMFTEIDDDGLPVPAHHPFTMPNAEDLGLLKTDPLRVRSQAYDLVLNGWELGSGSVRIHRSDIQQEIFEVLGIDNETARAKFGFLLDAFEYGAPPHAGFAFGIDRLVALLAGEENIREVIAYPKTQSGSDPLTNSPTEVDPRQLRDLGIQPIPKSQ